MLRTNLFRAAAFVGVAAAAWAQDSRSPAIVVDDQGEEIRVEVTDDIDSKALINDVRKTNPNQHWIGVGCGPVSDTLRAHLDIPAGQGTVVQQIVPDSPAEAAGIQVHDILIEAGGAPIATVDDLVVAIGNSGDQPMEMTWIRKGDRITKEITPVERPAQLAASVDVDASGINDVNSIRKWVEKLEKGEGFGDGPLRLKIFGPGIEMQGGSMPTNLKIQISRNGDNPAEIKVERGDSTWEVTEGQIGDLPEDVRPHVERMLGGGMAHIFRPPGKIGRLPKLNRLDIDIPWPEMEKKFEEMNLRMEEMMKRLEQLPTNDKQPNEDDEAARHAPRLPAV